MVGEQGQNGPGREPLAKTGHDFVTPASTAKRKPDHLSPTTTISATAMMMPQCTEVLSGSVNPPEPSAAKREVEGGGA